LESLFVTQHVVHEKFSLSMESGCQMPEKEALQHANNEKQNVKGIAAKLPELVAKGSADEPLACTMGNGESRRVICDRKNKGSKQGHD
jgi:hypothetical protein